MNPIISCIFITYAVETVASVVGSTNTKTLTHLLRLRVQILIKRNVGTIVSYRKLYL